MTPVEALQLYTAIKLHFISEDYDCVKYNYKTKNINFSKRKDKIQLNKLARQQDSKGLLIANLSINPKLWVGELFEQKAQQRYWDWKKYQNSQTYCFKEELKLLSKNSFETDGQHPEALKLYIRKKISLDTITILNDFLNFIYEWDKKLKNDVVWESIRLTIIKYRSFIRYDEDKISEIVEAHFA